MRKIMAIIMLVLIAISAFSTAMHPYSEKGIFYGSLKSSNKDIKIDGNFTDWNVTDVRAVDNYGDEYLFNDGYDDSRDIIAFYYHEGIKSLYFRLDFLDLKLGAEIKNLDFYIAINYTSGGQKWLPDFVETQTDTPWEICLAVYDTEHYAVYLSNWSYSNSSIDSIRYSAQWDSVELALNKTLLLNNGWMGGELEFQVYTTRDGTDGGAGEIPMGSRSNSDESDIVDTIGSSLMRGGNGKTGWLNGSISSKSHIVPTKIAFLHHANQFLKNVSYFVGDGKIGMYAVPKIHEYWHVPVNLHISGTLAEGIEYYRPDFNAYIKKLVKNGIAHMIGGFYDEYIPKYMPRDYNNWSMSYAKYYNEKYYNYSPRVCWIPERVFWHGWERTVKDGGYQIVVADTEVAFNWYHPSWAKEGRDEYYVWNDSGIKVLFISNTGRAGNWQNIQDMLPNPTDGGLNKNIRKLLLRNEIKDAHNRYLLYMDDWEKFFGNAPGWGGPEVVQAYNESIGWIAQHQWIKVSSLEELANLPVHGNIKIEDASYFWLTQNLGTAGSDDVGPNDSHDLYDAWYYDPYHEITKGVSFFNYTPMDNIEKLGDFRTPNTVIYDVWNKIKEIPESSPLYTVAMKTFGAMMYETAWRGEGISITMHDDISTWEKDQISHIKDCVLFYFAQRWLENETHGVWKEDVDMDGVKEGIIASKYIYGVIDPMGGKITFAISKSGKILIGNPTVGWHEQGDSITDIVGISTTNYHYENNPVPYNQGNKAYSFSDLGFENEKYNLSVENGKIIASNGFVNKSYAPWKDGIMVRYHTSIDIGVRITASPDFANLQNIKTENFRRIMELYNPHSNFSVFVAPQHAKFYLKKKITMATYLIYHSSGNFSFILRYGFSHYMNLPPYQVKKIPIIRVAEDSKESNILNISTYFEDDIDTNLNYSLLYNDTSGVYITLNGTMLNVDAKTGSKNDNWNGWINVTVVATDSMGKSCKSYFMVYIYPVNDPPEIELNIKNNATLSQDSIVNIRTIDVDGDSVKVWYKIDKSKYEKGHTVHIKVYELGNGEHNLIVKASDGHCVVYKNITFIVKLPERHPYIATVSAIILTVVLIGAAMRKRSRNSLI